MADRDYWGTPYDGARHPDRSDPSAHDDMHPIAWRERQHARFLAAISMEGDNDDED